MYLREELPSEWTVAACEAVTCSRKSSQVKSSQVSRNMFEQQTTKQKPTCTCIENVLPCRT